MKKASKWVAVVLAGFMALCLAGCGNLYENVMTVNGTEISSGMYLMMQQAAYNEARSKVEDQEKDVMGQKIDGVSAKKWVRERTEELCRRMVCVEDIAAQNEVYLADDSKNEISQTMESYWSYLEESYKEQGISQASFQHYLTYSSLADDLFDSLYGEGGKFYEPDAQLKKEYAEKYAHLKFVSIPSYTEDGSDDKKAEVTKLVEEIVQAMDNGQDFETVVTGDKMKRIYELLGQNFDAETISSSISDSYYRSYEDEGGTYSPEFLTALKAQKVGDHGYYFMESTLMIYEKMVPFADNEAFEAMRATVVKDLRYDAYDEYLKSIYDEYEVSKAFLAEWYFSPSKLEKD